MFFNLTGGEVTEYFQTTVTCFPRLHKCKEYHNFWFCIPLPWYVECHYFGGRYTQCVLQPSRAWTYVLYVFV